LTRCSPMKTLLMRRCSVSSIRHTFAIGHTLEILLPLMPRTLLAKIDRCWPRLRRQNPLLAQDAECWSSLMPIRQIQIAVHSDVILPDFSTRIVTELS
jgi:hypothetical protein